MVQHTDIGHPPVKVLLTFQCLCWFRNSRYVMVQVISGQEDFTNSDSQLVASKVIYQFKSRFMLGRRQRQTNSGELAGKQQVTSRNRTRALMIWWTAVKTCPQLGGWWENEGQLSEQVSGQLNLRVSNKIQKHTLWPGKESVSEAGEQAPQRGEEMIPTEPASPTSRTSLFLLLVHVSPYFILYSLSLILPVSSFFFCLFTLPTPSPPHSQRLCPQHYPDSSLKSSAWNHQITMEKERIQRRRRALEGENLFFTVSLVSLSPLHPFPHIFYISHCLHTLKVKTQMVSMAYPLFSLSLSVSPIPSILLCLSVCPPPCSLFLRLSVNGVL